MWSMSQPVDGVSQPEGCWQWRSRTSIARRNRPVKARAVEAAMTVIGSVEQDRFDVGGGEVGHDQVGGEHVAVGQFAQSTEGVVADEHA